MHSSTGSSKNKAIFVKPLARVFANQDEALLSTHFEVRSFTFGIHRGWRHIGRQFLLLLWLLRHVPGARLVYVWFADYHTLPCMLVARIFRVPGIVVIGGYDAVKMPRLDYGAHVRPFRSRVVRWSCRLASKVLTPSVCSTRQLVTNTGLDYGDKLAMVYNGVDTSIFTFTDEEREGVICVTICSDVRTLRVKGLDRVLEVAAHLPKIGFSLIGVTGTAAEWLSEGTLGNVKIIGVVPPEKLSEQYRRSAVICQLSRSESFGLAVAEGMASGCIPVVTAETGMEEVVDSSNGFVVPQSDVDEMVSAVRAATEASSEMRAKAAERIRTSFSLERRNAMLLNVIEDVMSGR